MRISDVGEQVAELAVELVVAVVMDTDRAVDHPEGVGEIFTTGAATELRRPSVQIPAIEQGNPWLFLRICGKHGQHQEGGDRTDGLEISHDGKSCYPLRGELPRALP